MPHSDSGPSRAAAAQTLGVKEDSADRTIQSAYRKLVRQVHPDKAKSDEDRKVREAATKQVTEAFTALMRKRGAGGALKKQAIEDGDGGVQFKPTSGSSKAKTTSKAAKAKATAKKPAEAPPSSKEARTELAKSIVDQIEEAIAPGAKRFRPGKSGGSVSQPAITGGLRPGKA